MAKQDLSAEFVQIAASGRTLSDFLAVALPRVASLCEAENAAIWAAVNGQWECVASTAGQSNSNPASDSLSIAADAELADLLAESSDSGQSQVRDSQLAYPLRQSPWNSAVLVISPVDASDPSRAAMEILDSIAPSLQSLLGILQSSTYQYRRVERLESLLKIANSWYQIREMEPLLHKMAEVATELLQAERATIFLWDRRRKQLVGRPALGVADNELRIPEDMGVVGRVIATAAPERANSGDPSIAQNVEAASDFQTRNLVCVPLISQRGRTLGAFELLNKRDGEFTTQDERELTELAISAAAAIDNCRNYQSLLSSRDKVSAAPDQVRVLGDSPAIQKVRDVVERVAPSDLPVLVLGENGTGKEVVSRQIHQMSERANKPFLAVNCAALTRTLLESELFGHEKGAFTDAHETRPGKFEVANGGTLMLDEIGDLPLESQAKLLRVLEEQTVVRVGGTESHAINTRVIAATNCDLGAMVRERAFREDLFFRLNVVTLDLPPLRDRGDDILLLAQGFLDEFCEASGREVPAFTTAAKKRLLHHRWPGNVRELRNLMERLAFLSSEEEIDADELPFSEDQNDEMAGDLPLSEATRQFQMDYIRGQIRAADGNMTEAARRLGLHRSNLYRKMGQLGLEENED